MIIIKKHPFQLSIYLSNVNKISPYFSIWQIRRCSSAVLNLGCTLDYPESFQKKKKICHSHHKTVPLDLGMRPGHWQVDKHSSRRIIYKNQFETIWLFQDLVIEWTGPLHSQRIRDKTVLVLLSFPGRCQICTMKKKKIPNSVFPGYLLVGGEGNMLMMSH